LSATVVESRLFRTLTLICQSAHEPPVANSFELNFRCGTSSSSTFISTLRGLVLCRTGFHSGEHTTPSRLLIFRQRRNHQESSGNMAKDNTPLVFHIPTQFYNGCYFPFVTPEGQAVYERIQNQFRPSPHSDNAIIDILDGLKKLYSTTIAGLALCELEMDGEPFWGSLLLDHRMALVSAFRHYTSLEHFSSDTQLRFEETILESMPNRQYLLGCSYFCDKPDKRHLFRFTYVDRQASFISAHDVHCRCLTLALPGSNKIPCLLLHP
jgi:hypothetical protein